MKTHSSILARITPWTEEPGRLQSIGLKSCTGVSDWVCTHTQWVDTESSTTNRYARNVKLHYFFKIKLIPSFHSTDQEEIQPRSFRVHKHPLGFIILPFEILFFKATWFLKADGSAHSMSNLSTGISVKSGSPISLPSLSRSTTQYFHSNVFPGPKGLAREWSVDHRYFWSS